MAKTKQSNLIARCKMLNVGFIKQNKIMEMGGGVEFSSLVVLGGV